MKILLTGGAGFIGSHTWLALTEAGFTPVILDDFSNSHVEVLSRLEKISGKPVIWHQGNVSDVELVRSIILQHCIGAVVHFAAFKAVSESVIQPLTYYDNNLGGITRLLQAMDACDCRQFIFSSSAAVYGDPASVPITEHFPRAHTNPYAHTKLVCEDMLTALHISNSAWKIAVLRYFNPVGAHDSGLIGENPAGTPSNLMPYLAQVAVGKQPHLTIYGNDYSTPDGTGVRDYIHVQDLAQGHVAAVRTLVSQGQGFTVNLGSGQGHSVLEVVQAFEKASGCRIPYRFAGRRAGDVAQCFSEVSRSYEVLGWRTTHTLADMCADTWRWQKANPNGYRVVGTQQTLP